MKILALVTDAFGGKGGIAKFNRDLLISLSESSNCHSLLVIPRLKSHDRDSLPPNIIYDTRGINSKAKYCFCLFLNLFSRSKCDLIICGHINLLPLAFLMRIKNICAPIVLISHGVEVWKPTKSILVNFLATKVTALVAVSRFTQESFQSWCNFRQTQFFLLPNSIDLDKFGTGNKSNELVQKYALEDKSVIMTLARLDPAERYKGIDETMEAIPELSETFPNVVYMVMGEGEDRSRLEAKALSLKVQDRVVFTGHVPESEKADHYRLADAYVMPGTGEGFGIVYLEALACGVPVVASKLDASREAVRNGELGLLVNPRDRRELIEGITNALRAPRGEVPAGIEYFTFKNFQQRLDGILESLLPCADNQE